MRKFSGAGLSRRTLLAGGAGGWAFIGSSFFDVAARGAPRRKTNVRKTFSTYMDTLFPGDALSPSASSLGVDLEMLKEVEGNPRLKRSVEKGCAWLDAIARKEGVADFSQLGTERCSEIVGLMENARARSGPARFFRFARDRGVHYYYAHSESWDAIGYSGPPQWDGFPDHAERPEPPK